MRAKVGETTDPDMADFYDAWRASLLGREVTPEAAYEAGWAGCLKSIKAYRDYENRIADDLSDLRSTVREALDNSLVNGFDPRNARDAEYLAQDLCELDADLENVQPAAIIPFIQEWLVDNR